MKLSDLKKAYSEAKVAVQPTRETLETVESSIQSAGYTSGGHPFVQLDKGIKVLIDDEWKIINRVVMFNEDVDIFKGMFHTQADVIHLNGLKSPKAKVIVFAYENEQGEASVSHSVKIILSREDEARLIKKATQSPAQSSVVQTAQNVFE
jgi:hypothetical protein